MPEDWLWTAGPLIMGFIVVVFIIMLVTALCRFCWARFNGENLKEGTTTTTVISQPGPVPGYPDQGYGGGGYPPHNAPYQAAQLPMPQPGSYPTQPTTGYYPPPPGGPYPQGPPMPPMVDRAYLPPHGFAPSYPPPAGGPYPPPGGPYPPGPYPPGPGAYPPGPGAYPPNPMHLPPNPMHPPPYDIAMQQPPAPAPPQHEGYGKQAPYNPHY